MKLSFVNLLVLVSAATAQLSGHVGPTTSTAAKRAKKTCSVLDYGAKADKSTDLGAALTKAWAACASGGIGKSSTSAYTTLPNHGPSPSCAMLTIMQLSSPQVTMPCRPGLP